MLKFLSFILYVELIQNINHMHDAQKYTLGKKSEKLENSQSLRV